MGCVRSSAWHWLFSSTHSTSAFSGGLRYRPTTSRSFSMKNGSVDSLKLSLRCGWRPSSLKYRWTLVAEIVVSAAIVRTLQCVEPSAGLVCNVLWINSATRSSSIVRGLPGRTSSYRPLMRCSRNRARHLPTVARVSCRRLAISLFGSPAAAARTMRARVTSAAGIERERVIEASCDCSASLNINSTFGRPIGMLVSPVPLIPTSYANIVQLTTEQDTSCLRSFDYRPVARIRKQSLPGISKVDSAIESGLIAGLLYLQHAFDLSDEEVVW